MASIESAVYSFEGLLPELESPPIAARRALDHGGLRLSVEGWRSLSADERAKVTLAGVPDRIDVELVGNLARRASPPPQRISPVSDPDALTPPEALAKALEPARTIDPRRWARLRAVDRYALAHMYRRAVARSAFSILGEAFDAVLAVSNPPPDPDAGLTPKPPELRGRGAVEVRSGARQPYSSPPPAPEGGYYSNVPREASTAGPRRVERISEPPEDPFVRRSSVRPPPQGPLSNHLTEGGEVHMVDVARKPETERRAVARGSVVMQRETMHRLVGRAAPKGEVLATARIAAIMAAKRTHEIIPLCHPVALTHVEIDLELDVESARVIVTAIADAYDRTGCEMEAMVAVTTACLTIYDMLKGIDRDIVIADVRLMEKSGGRSGHYKRGEGEE